MEQPTKKQKIEQSINYFNRLPKEIIMHILCFAMPVLQNKEQCKNENWEEKIVLHMPEEFFAPDLLTYKNVSESCKKFKQILLEDRCVINLLKYFKEQKKRYKELREQEEKRKKEEYVDPRSDDWDTIDW